MKLLCFFLFIFGYSLYGEELITEQYLRDDGTVAFEYKYSQPEKNLIKISYRNSMNSFIKKEINSEKIKYILYTIFDDSLLNSKNESEVIEILNKVPSSQYIEIIKGKATLFYLENGTTQKVIVKNGIIIEKSIITVSYKENKISLVSTNLNSGEKTIIIYNYVQNQKIQSAIVTSKKENIEVYFQYNKNEMSIFHIQGSKKNLVRKNFYDFNIENSDYCFLNDFNQYITKELLKLNSIFI